MCIGRTTIEELDEHRGVDAVLIALEGSGPLEVLGALRARAPEAAVLVVTDPDREADGAVALHGGAEDHLVRGSIPDGFLPRAIRYAIAQRRLRRELSTSDEVTGLPNLRGFAPIAEHHLRMADRAKTPVVFVFVRLDGLRPPGPPVRTRPRSWCARRPTCCSKPSATPTSPPGSRRTPSPCCSPATRWARRRSCCPAWSRRSRSHDTRPADRHVRSPCRSAAPCTTRRSPPRSSQILETAGRRLGDQRPEGSSEA